MVFFSLLLLCFLLPAIVHGRTLPRGHRYSFDFLNDKVYDFSDDVSILTYFNKDRSQSRSLKQTLPAALEMEEASPPCPSSHVEKTAPSLDLYHIGDFKFSVPTRTSAGILKRKVVAECGFLLGLTDFTEIPPFGNPQDSTSSPELWFRWNRLRAKCQISTVLDGLKGKGEADVLVKPLVMLVRVPPTEPSLPEIEMTRAKEVTVSLQGLDALPPEATKAISSDIESRMICIVNNEIRDILKDSMKSSIEKQPSANFTKLIFDRQP
ncbi:hypothetical protein HNY73_007910 [Argiope bruennichi]|uniref:Uncharacterized protein n=1 Tax=Argiope bruennichi TaxID=94029 RepID=A0A8T0FB30_ARGBR|nr:hypothetical protein HNY73_007910 [Argiope bruennichi]